MKQKKKETRYISNHVNCNTSIRALIINFFNVFSSNWMAEFSSAKSSDQKKR